GEGERGPARARQGGGDQPPVEQVARPEHRIQDDARREGRSPGRVEVRPHPLMPPLALGILGCANIARAFIRDVRPSPHVRVDAVASRNADNAAAFAAENGVARSHGSYEALLADPEIEAIYLP